MEGWRVGGLEGRNVGGRKVYKYQQRRKIIFNRGAPISRARRACV